MAIKLNREESLFRNELVFTADAKAVNIDNILVNLFMLLKHDGIRPRQRARSNAFIEMALSPVKNIAVREQTETSIIRYFNLFDLN